MDKCCVPAPEQAPLLLSPALLPQGLLLLSLACSPTKIDGNFQRKRVSDCSSLRKTGCVNKQRSWPSLSSQSHWLLCLQLLGSMSVLGSEAGVPKSPEGRCSDPPCLCGRIEDADIW